MTLKKVIYFILITQIFGCSSNENYEINSLWYIREHTYTPKVFTHCDECDTESVNCCIYNYDNKLYNRGESYVLDYNGKIDSVYSYRIPLGVSIISVEDQIRLSTLDSAYRQQLRNRKIYWDSELNSIVDGNSIYKDFEVDSDKKYLIVKTDSELKLYKYN